MSRTILIGSLIGAAVGSAIAWAYHEFTTDEEEAAGSRSRLQFQADAGDMVKLGFAVIPLVRMVTKLFVPVDETPASLSAAGDRD
jgi:hypothetical protein